MADSEWDEENPYASPKGMDEGLIREEPEEDPEEFVMEPSLRPRDLIDGLSSLFVVFEATVLLGLVAAATGALAYCLPGEWGGILALAILCVLFPAGASYELLCRLHGLRIDAAGIAFKRRLGKPKFLAWGEIRAIRPATRWEVLVYAWLWLWLEPTKSESTRGHYRIEWTGGYLYFPPKDPVVFEKALRKFCPRLPGGE